MKLKKLLFTIFIFSQLFNFISCKQNRTEYNLDKSLYWTKGNQQDTLDIAKTLEYKPLKAGFKNLFDLVGREPTYIWVKIPFILPENLQNKELGFVIPYLHFAEKVWLNDTFIGETGQFYPKPYSPLYSSHFYSVPHNSLNLNGENTIYIQILSQGLGTISDGIILDKYDEAKRKANTLNFIQSKIYLIFDGILICAMILFFMIYLARKKDIHILSFSILCMLTAFFLTYFFWPELPNYSSGRISSLLYTKIMLCSFLFLIIISIVAFMLNFVKLQQPKFFVIFKYSVLIISIVIVLCAPTYSALMKLTVPMIIIYLLHFLFGLNLIIKELFDKIRKQSAINVLIGFTPMAISVVADIIVRFIFRNIKFPYFAIIGWLSTILYFMFYIAMDFNKLFIQNERLNKNLKHEVDIQTVDLTYANEKLNQKQIQTNREMDMAAVVQQKFFDPPKQNYNGWEIGFYYNPLEKVSGDLYDFFEDNEQLNGIALFDASGHGVAAALITMLSKNIIRRSFLDGLNNSTPIDKILSNINTLIINSKGKIDNYLTGILLRISNENSKSEESQEENKTTVIEMGNAGHPYPIFYSAQNDCILDLRLLETAPHYGAIAMNGIDSLYSDFKFTIKTNDILVLFTDGVTEVHNKDHQEFGRTTVENLILENHNLSANELCKKIQMEINNFCGEQPKDDDISIIILKKI